MFGLMSCFFLAGILFVFSFPRRHLQPLSHPPLPTPPVLLHLHLLRYLRLHLLHLHLLRYLLLHFQRHKLFCLLDAWCLAWEKRDADAGEMAWSCLKLEVAWSCLKLEIKKSFRNEIKTGVRCSDSILSSRYHLPKNLDDTIEHESTCSIDVGAKWNGVERGVKSTIWKHHGFTRWHNTNVNLR